MESQIQRLEKTFILASLKRSAFKQITNVTDFCTAHFQPSHIFKTIYIRNILKQIFPMMDDKNSACFVRDVWWAKSCLCKNIMMIHGYQNTCLENPISAASNATLPQKLISALLCPGIYAILDIEGVNCRKQQHVQQPIRHFKRGS